MPTREILQEAYAGERPLDDAAVPEAFEALLRDLHVEAFQVA